MAKLSGGGGVSSALLRYNARIIVLNSYWLFVVPLVASQLLIFWYMAMAAMLAGSAAFVARTTELAAPLFAAFLCAHVLAPEYRYRLEDVVFSRPVPFARTVVARLVTMFAFLCLLIAMMLAVYSVGLKADYDLKTVLLAGLPSVFFLSMLSLAVAAVWHSPVAGLSAASAVWVADVLLGARFNPLFTLHAYTAKLAETVPADTNWLISKALLTLGGLLLAWVTIRAVGRSASPLKARSLVRATVVLVLFLALHLGSGAVYKMQGLVAREAAARDLDTIRSGHQDAFAVYGRLPVAYLFSRAYADYIGFPIRRAESWEYTYGRQRLADQLTRVAFRHPDSKWADNALYELIRIGSAVADDRRAIKVAGAGGVLDRQTAVSYSRQFLRDYPESAFAPDVAARLTNLAAESGDTTTLAVAYDTLMTRYPASPHAAATVLMFMRNDKRPATMAATAQAAASRMSDAANPSDLIGIGDLLRSIQRPDLAESYYRQAIVAGKRAVADMDEKQKIEQKPAAEFLRERGGASEAVEHAQATLNEVEAGVPLRPAPPPSQSTGSHPRPRRSGGEHGGRDRGEAQGGPDSAP